MKMVGYNKDSPLKQGIWLGAKTSQWMGQVIVCGEKIVKLQRYASDSRKQMTRDELERQVENGDFIILNEGSPGWNRRVEHFRTVVLWDLAETMQKYGLDIVMLLPATFLPHPAVVGKGKNGETYSVMLGKE